METNPVLGRTALVFGPGTFVGIPIEKFIATATFSACYQHDKRGSGAMALRGEDIGVKPCRRRTSGEVRSVVGRPPPCRGKTFCENPEIDAEASSPRPISHASGSICPSSARDGVRKKPQFRWLSSSTFCSIGPIPHQTKTELHDAKWLLTARW